MFATLRLRIVVVLCATFFMIACGGSSAPTPPSNPTPSPAPVTPAPAPAPTPNVTISITPPGATLAPNGTQQFTATVLGTSNTSVTWSIKPSADTTSNLGTISATGLYTAPATVPNPSELNINAVPAADTTKVASASVSIRTQHPNQDFQDPPIKLGTSGGNATDKTTSTDPTTGKIDIFCCSGTLGSLISRGRSLFILSNNHVLDKSDQGAVQDPISQPGLADTRCGQSPNTIVANLAQSAPLTTSNVDAAMGLIANGKVDTAGTILELGPTGQSAPPSGTVASAVVGLNVAKSGDATGLTCSSINAIGLTVKVTYTTQCQGGTPFTVLFRNQVSVDGSTFSNNGDSGSLIVTTDNARPVAMLFAGSSIQSVGNPIQDVLTALKDPTTSEVPQLVGGSDHPVACPAAPQASSTQQQVGFAPQAAMAKASEVKSLRAMDLLQDPSVDRLDVGQSEDNLRDAAIVVYVKSEPRIPIPAQIDGIRTKIVREPILLSAKTIRRLNGFPAIAEAEVQRATDVKERHADTLMSDSSILGVGVGASSDDIGKSAIVIFVQKGKQTNMPTEIDGVRTKIIESDPFRAFDWGKRTRSACSRR